MHLAGVDLPTLKELMGHSSISTTMRYVHPTPEHKRQSVGKLEQFNAEQIFALYEGHAGPHKSPHSNRRDTDFCCFQVIEKIWWAHQDSNLGPTDYESAALTAELWAREARPTVPVESVSKAIPGSKSALPIRLKSARSLHLAVR